MARLWIFLRDEFAILVGQERSPTDKVFGCTLEVYPLNSGEQAAGAVRRWNEQLGKAVEVSQ